MARATRSSARVDTVLLAACIVASLLCLVLPTGTRQTFADNIRQTFIAPLISLQVQAERARGAFIVRDITAARLDSLILKNADLRDMELENGQLRALLGLGARLRNGFVAAEALHRPEMGEAQTVVITAGTRAGVVERSAVVAPEGLIGKVIGTGDQTSTAILWTHPDFAVSAMSANGNVFGIIKPHVGADVERFMLELRGVAFRDSLLPGIEIRSSGLGTVFPRGIPIGTVVKDITTPGAYSRTYLVRPMVMPADVTVVMVLLPTSGNVESVWKAPSADSMRKAIGNSSDSLARARRDTMPGDSVSRRP
ncbi:MAG TPA: rod shape-determining protein MreC [Gemmatimonadaceae bacterium]|nr:rod shape-determining protein MreC [Gemmatimonadaceae bacterium]